MSETQFAFSLPTEAPNALGLDFQSTLTTLNLVPGKLYVLLRDNKNIVSFNLDKITIAMTKAYLAVEGQQAAASRRVHEEVSLLANEVAKALSRQLHLGGIVHIEDIQDQVELALMRHNHKVAKAYILYREERRQERDHKKQHNLAKRGDTLLHTTLDNGQVVPLDLDKLETLIQRACHGLEDVDAHRVIEETVRNLFDGVKMADVHKALIMTTRTLIEFEPHYAYVAARLLRHNLFTEALHFLKLPTPSTPAEEATLYTSALSLYIEKGIALELLSPELLSFDLERLAQALKPERDFQFNYLGLQTLYDRYFIHHQGTRFELPQIFFMRVAMGLALREPQKNERAMEFYELLSSFDYMSSTPTLFNSGTLRPQLSSCYLTTVPDDLSGIYNAIRDNALLSKFAGGLGNDWTPVRGMGAHIKGTNGTSQGVVPFMKVANDTAVAVNQGGKRKGAVCAYLESWHIDIEEFLELRKNTGDDRRRTHDMNTANWVPDLLMKRIFEDAEWTLFSPNDTPDLHDRFGLDFEKAYTDYEAKTRTGEITVFKTLPARHLWRKMLGLIYETGHPWITFKDPCNLRSPQQHVGVIHSSNLCTEITLNTSNDEIAVCNLGSINLAQHLSGSLIDRVKLRKTIQTAIRMLDNVIDINYYSVPQAQHSNLLHRPIGLGLMGFQDALYQLDIAYASPEAVEFADRSMELISYYAIEASMMLAQERGSYTTFEGSLWSQGILPIDSIELLATARSEAYFTQDRSQTLDWNALRTQVKQKGMRNSNVMAIAPTATISNICGVTQSIEPTFQNLYVKSNLSGEFTVVNPYLVADLKSLNLWDSVMVDDLKYFDGSLQGIDRIPAHLKAKYATAFELPAEWLIEAGSRRQKWIDQSQSLNIYMAQPSGKKMDSIYKMAWRLGLKTTYYCRTRGASDTEKSTVAQGVLNAVALDTTSEAALPKMCIIDNPECEACQ